MARDPHSTSAETLLGPRFAKPVPIFVAAFVAAGFATTEALASVQLVETGANLFEVRVTGKIEKGDANHVRAALIEAKRLSPSHVKRQSVRFDSIGGDVDAAMEVGRTIRALGAITTAQNCISACVIAFAGGVGRYALTDDQLRFGLGTHRIYFSAIDPNATIDQIRSMRAAALSRVREYLRDMDVDESLVSQMEATPPERVRFLSQDEAERLRLFGTDTAHDEQETAKSAWLYGISSAEYRERRLRAEQDCRAVDGKGRKLWTLDEATPYALALLLNSSPQEASRRLALTRQRCKPSTPPGNEDTIRNCVRNVFVNGR